MILVGEVRDKETAMIAVQASLTGHMVLTTLHTIDAASSVTRLMDIGIESYKIAAAIKGVVAQRLLRRLCPHCRELWWSRSTIGSRSGSRTVRRSTVRVGYALSARTRGSAGGWR